MDEFVRPNAYCTVAQTIGYDLEDFDWSDVNSIGIPQSVLVKTVKCLGFHGDDKKLLELVRTSKRSDSRNYG